MKKLFLFLFPICIYSQDASIGQWKNYLSYNSASHIAEAKDKIYCVSSEGLFFVNKEDQTINRISKINGLSDVSVKQVAHSNELNITLIAYKNCNIDIITNTSIINVSDIKRKEITGNKKINNITINDHIAYLSCPFGLVLVDLINNEIKDTYYIGNEITTYEINGCAFLGDSIIVATNQGLFFANKNSQNLSYYNSWSAYSEHNNETTYDNIVSGENHIHGDYSLETTSISYNNNTLVTTYKDKVDVLRNDGVYNQLTNSNFENIKYAWHDSDGCLWVADSTNGLLKFQDYNFDGKYSPEGPVRNDVYSLEFAENKLYQCHGGHLNFGSNALINSGVSIKDAYDGWINHDRYALGNARDILEVAVKNGSEYYASWYHGIPEMRDGELVIKYGFNNTGGALDTCWYSNNRIRISDIKFDSNENMWALSSEVNHPIVVKTKNNTWYSYSMNQNQVGLFLDDLIIDSYNQKWGILARGGGVFVFDENNTIEDYSDDRYTILNTNIGSGNLPSLQTYSLAEDLNGEIWIGTDKGVAVFYNPQNVFSGNNFDSQQILITEGDYGQYLLSEEKVKCIVIDGANRKWIGTEKSGVFLLSENGEQEIKHFTENNSPLFSNNIIDITINHEIGEVFIGTERGLLSYRSDATKGSSSQNSTTVFPNPVKESYNGPIAIKGLVYNARVKITDINGDLVFETNANGGQAIWGGKTKSGKRAATGVYLVFSTDAEGNEKIVSKILFIH